MLPLGSEAAMVENYAIRIQPRVNSRICCARQQRAMSESARSKFHGTMKKPHDLSLHKQRMTSGDLQKSSARVQAFPFAR